MRTRPVCATKTLPSKTQKLIHVLRDVYSALGFVFFFLSIIKAKQSNSIANSSPLTLLSEIQVHISLFTNVGGGVKKP